MRNVYLFAIASSFIFNLGMKASAATAAFQPNGQQVIDVPENTLPSLPPKVNPPNRNLTTDELFQQQQNRWQNQQELWQQQQAGWQRRMDLKLQQQNTRQLREIQRQQEFMIRGKYPSIFLR
jgi:hypothetical protein